MAAVSTTRQWARTALLAAIILAVGLTRQYANADGVFQADGFVQTATASVSQWWNDLSLVDDAGPATPPEPTAGGPQSPVAVTTIPTPAQAAPPIFAGAPADPFAYGPFQHYGHPQSWPVHRHCR
jgi:hypothetical protein